MRVRRDNPPSGVRKGNGDRGRGRGRGRCEQPKTRRTATAHPGGAATLLAK